MQRVTRNRVSLFTLFLIGEGLAFAIIPASTNVSSNVLLYAQAAITVALLGVALIARGAAGARSLRPVSSALFVGALALLVSQFFGESLQQLTGYSLDDASGIALAKLTQSVLRALPILLLLGLTAKGRELLFLQRGRLGLGLSVGTVALLIFGTLAYGPLAGDGPVLRKVLSWTPWVLLFIFANAFEEELLFRGLFLKRYEPLLGSGLSNLLTAIVFTVLHMQVTYASDLIQFLLILFPLGLAFGYLMQKSDSLWGSVLFHAGADLLLIVPLFAAL